MVRICVQDDGPGIPENVLVRIFDPFFTTKLDASGTGLGLSICHGIVSEHGGHIWAESKVGEGTTVLIELPMSLGEENKKAVEAVDKNESLLNPESRVLILDDEPNIQGVLTQALQNQGYTVDTVSNGVDGMLRIAEMKYNVILCDIHMPGFSGLEFYRRVQAWQPELAKKSFSLQGILLTRQPRHLLKNTMYSIWQNHSNFRTYFGQSVL
jgi:CheY-like chemotaxis protein